MTKAEISERLSRQSGINKKEALFIIDNFLKAIIESVKSGDKVEIRGFGTFYKAKRKGRVVYSPIAKGSIHIPDKEILAFKTSKVNEFTKE